MCFIRRFYCLRPQNTLDAIAHLTRVTSATYLIVHPTLLHRGREIISELPAVKLVEQPSRSACFDSIRQPIDYARDFREDADRTAVIMHTSGSTNMPKVSQRCSRLSKRVSSLFNLAHIPVSQDMDRTASVYAWSSGFHDYAALPRTYRTTLRWTR